MLETLCTVFWEYITTTAHIWVDIIANSPKHLAKFSVLGSYCIKQVIALCVIRPWCEKGSPVGHKKTHCSILRKVSLNTSHQRAAFDIKFLWNYFLQRKLTTVRKHTLLWWYASFNNKKCTGIDLRTLWSAEWPSSNGLANEKSGCIALSVLLTSCYCCLFLWKETIKNVLLSVPALANVQLSWCLDRMSQIG